MTASHRAKEWDIIPDPRSMEIMPVPLLGHHSLFPEAVSTSGMTLEMGVAPGCLPCRVQPPGPGQPVTVGTLWRGHCPQCQQLHPGSLPCAHMLLGCSRSELSPLISAASLHVRHAEEPGKNGVIQVHPVVSHLKYSHCSSAVTASVGGLPHPCHRAVLELP